MRKVMTVVAVLITSCHEMQLACPSLRDGRFADDHRSRRSGGKKRGPPLRGVGWVGYRPVPSEGQWRAPGSCRSSFSRTASLGTRYLEHLEPLADFEPAPLLAQLSFELLPAAFNSVPVHPVSDAPSRVRKLCEQSQRIGPKIPPYVYRARSYVQTPSTCSLLPSRVPRFGTRRMAFPDSCVGRVPVRPITEGRDSQQSCHSRKRVTTGSSARTHGGSDAIFNREESWDRRSLDSWRLGRNRPCPAFIR